MSSRRRGTGSILAVWLSSILISNHESTLSSGHLYCRRISSHPSQVYISSVRPRPTLSGPCCDLPMERDSHHEDCRSILRSRRLASQSRVAHKQLSKPWTPMKWRLADVAIRARPIDTHARFGISGLDDVESCETGSSKCTYRPREANMVTKIQRCSLASN